MQKNISDLKRAKEMVAPWRVALYEGDEMASQKIISSLAPNPKIHMCHPFGDFSNSEEFFSQVFSPLFKAWPDLERRDYIVIAGEDEEGAVWVGCGGYYTGVFVNPWCDIPPTGHQVQMRFHEFYRVEKDVVEIHLLWDIPEVMMQSRAWPMMPSLGRNWHVPAPATQDGLQLGDGVDNRVESLATRQHIIDMLTFMKKHPQQPPEAMEMERFWHEKMNWYGPAGIGTARGIAGFRHWHQIPFLKGMPDRGQYVDEITYNFFAEGPYAAVTGWPNMIQTLTHDGWLGIPPVNKRITLRSLDFWRLEKGKIRENWVLVDLLDMYSQIGVDVFARMRDFNKVRSMGAIKVEKDY